MSQAPIRVQYYLVDGRGVVHPDLGLLCVVADTHADVLVAAQAPDVVRHLEPDNNEEGHDDGDIIKGQDDDVDDTP